MSNIENRNIEFIRATALAALAKGRIATITFTKKDGTEREMNCRLGVTKHLKGGSNTCAHIENILTVFDVKKEAYRNINLNTITSIKGCGEIVRFA